MTLWPKEVLAPYVDWGLDVLSQHSTHFPPHPNCKFVKFQCLAEVVTIPRPESPPAMPRPSVALNQSNYNSSGYNRQQQQGRPGRRVPGKGWDLYPQDFQLWWSPKDILQIRLTNTVEAVYEDKHGGWKMAPEEVDMQRCEVCSSAIHPVHLREVLERREEALNNARAAGDSTLKLGEVLVECETCFYDRDAYVLPTLKKRNLREMMNQKAEREKEERRRLEEAEQQEKELIEEEKRGPSLLVRGVRALTGVDLREALPSCFAARSAPALNFRDRYTTDKSVDGAGGGQAKGTRWGRIKLDPPKRASMFGGGGQKRRTSLNTLKAAAKMTTSFRGSVKSSERPRSPDTSRGPPKLNMKFGPPLDEADDEVKTKGDSGGLGDVEMGREVKVRTGESIDQAPAEIIIPSRPPLPAATAEPRRGKSLGTKTSRTTANSRTTSKDNSPAGSSVTSRTSSQKSSRSNRSEYRNAGSGF
eukprot:CAMPEP_0172635352 /NCGR_PEP_ID=MMETSP1068-20121228/199013_1 /TAXON_ID=35684 /ORGANISM="Pseudopedinella elastica, Strain CCMP716" /LENGTH=472 /DNA_ID=CAMNT_0013447541 /DNA_START=60 /DNA_END=1478 /DNA_ORIENTATION=+